MQDPTGLTNITFCDGDIYAYARISDSTDMWIRENGGWIRARHHGGRVMDDNFVLWQLSKNHGTPFPQILIRSGVVMYGRDQTLPTALDNLVKNFMYGSLTTQQTLVNENVDVLSSATADQLTEIKDQLPEMLDNMTPETNKKLFENLTPDTIGYWVEAMTNTAT